MRSSYKVYNDNWNPASLKDNMIVVVHKVMFITLNKNPKVLIGCLYIIMIVTRNVSFELLLFIIIVINDI
jgi:hypothetical protein